MSELLARHRAVMPSWMGLYYGDQVLAMRGSNHGRSFGAVAVTGNPSGKMTSHSPFCAHFLHGTDGWTAIGGVVARGGLLGGIRGNGISTFGGSPLSTAAANATPDYLLSHDLHRVAADNGTLITNGLRVAAAGLRGVGEVRGKGLMFAVDLVDPVTGQPSPRPVLWAKAY